MTGRFLTLSLKHRVILLMVAIAVVTAVLTAATMSLIDFYKLRDNFRSDKKN